MSAFIPFSFGPANCVGKNLAYQEMRMVICVLMQKFDMRFEDGFDVKSWEVDMLDYFVTIKGKLPVVLTPRNG
jgi:cytochrome P450